MERQTKTKFKPIITLVHNGAREHWPMPNTVLSEEYCTSLAPPTTTSRMCKWPINGLDSEIKLWSTTATDCSVFELTGLSVGLFWNNKNPVWYAHPSQHGVAGGETLRLSSALGDGCPPPWPLESPETQSGPPTAIMPKSRCRHPFFPHFPSVWTGKDRLVT